MWGKLKSIFQWGKCKVIKYNELIMIPIGWYLVKWSEPFITKTYPGSVRYDTGFFYDVIYAVAAGFIIHGVSYIMFKINWLLIERYLDINLDEDFKTLTPLQRILIAVWLFQSYFWSFIALFLIVSWTGVK